LSEKYSAKPDPEIGFPSEKAQTHNECRVWAFFTLQPEAEMIKLVLTFNNKKKTVVSSEFEDIKSIKPWLDKVEVLNEKDKLKNKPGFIKEK
jgi:hypothetical protein